MKLRVLPLMAVPLLMAYTSVGQMPPSSQSQCRINPKLPNMYGWFASSSAALGKVYAISSERRSKIVRNYSKLRVGMSSKDVEALLGSADYEDAGFRNSGFRPDGSRDSQDHCAALWGYYFKKTGENLADPNDSILIVEFNAERRLNWAAPQNIRQLFTIGAPID